MEQPKGWQKNGQEFVAKITIMEIKMMMWHLLRWIGCMSREIGSGDDLLSYIGLAKINV